MQAIFGNKYKQAIKNMAMAAKKRRNSRIAANQPVLGFKMMQRRQAQFNRGQAKAQARGPFGPQQVTSTETALPVTVATTTVKRNPLKINVVRKCEYSSPVYSVGPGVVAPEPIALNPMNTDLFKALPNIASQYQYYRFLGLNFKYAHSIDTGNPGQLGFGIAASSETAAAVTTFDQIASLNSAKQGAVYTDVNFAAQTADFNQQFALQGCAIKPWEATDDSNPQYVAGYLVTGQTGVTAAKGVQLGTITIEYLVQLIKEKVDSDPQGPPPTTLVTPARTASNDWWPSVITQYNLQTWTHKSVALSRLSLSQLVLTFSDQRTYMVQLVAFAAPTTLVTLTCVNCLAKLTHSKEYVGAGKVFTWVITSQAKGATATIANDGSTSNGCALNIHAVKSQPVCITGHGAGLA